MNKIKIAKELKNTLTSVKCEECPLDEMCDIVRNSDDNLDCFCTRLDNIIKNESEEK